MTAENKTIANVSPLTQAREKFAWFRDTYPQYFLLLLITIVPLFLMSPTAWLTMTLGGLAMGMMIFIMSSGMTLTFGLMGVLNLAHGAFIALGAFLGFTAISFFTDWARADSLLLNVASIMPMILLALVVCGALGYFFERLIIKPVGYKDHLKQILVTIGGAIIIEQLIHVIWGPNELVVQRPEALRGAIILGDASLEIYRIFAVVVGALVFWGMVAIINKTKAGILIRAGVESTENVEIHGYRIKLLFMAVFIAGSALGGLGGVMWAMYGEIITAHMGAHLMVTIIVVIIIGGLGSVTGCFFAALAVGLINLYAGFLEPRLAGVASVGLMVAVLMWRPQGLIPVIKA